MNPGGLLGVEDLSGVCIHGQELEFEKGVTLKGC